MGLLEFDTSFSLQSPKQVAPSSAAQAKQGNGPDPGQHEDQLPQARPEPGVVLKARDQIRNGGVQETLYAPRTGLMGPPDHKAYMLSAYT